MIKKVYKFGGASVKDADSVRNLKNIIEKEDNNNILMVVSAMGKTTNAIEKALAEFRAAEGHLGIEAISEITEYHEQILLDLFNGDSLHPVFDTVTQLFLELYLNLQETGYDYDFQYDQTVSYGELVSTTIISAYLNKCGVENDFVDAREYILTDHCFRAANPNWDETRLRVQKLNDKHNGKLLITQGFIGFSDNPKATVTLGREGSDFTAAIFANCLDAEEVVIWKDVDGIRNADPKRFQHTEKMPHLSYLEAIELSFYGASVIHPKTIKPLQNKNIPLKVRCFLNTGSEPTLIDGSDEFINYAPSYIVKERQTLVSITARDFSFMNEYNLGLIFQILDELNVHANMVQTSALTLSLCFDEDNRKLDKLLNSLSNSFRIKYNNGLQLFTIRHYKENIEKEYVGSNKILVEQRSRNTYQAVIEGAS